MNIAYKFTTARDSDIFFLISAARAHTHRGVVGVGGGISGPAEETATDQNFFI
jgi:hypothetical protein